MLTDEMFTIACTEPDLTGFASYLSGRVDEDSDFSRLFVKYYNEWKGLGQ